VTSSSGPENAQEGFGVYSSETLAVRGSAELLLARGTYALAMFTP
jgi:hypothetical protein